MERYLYIGLVALVCWSCAKHENAAHEQAPLRVKTMVVAPQETNVTSRYVGAIEPVHATPLSMQATGRVVAVHVKNGDRVHQGQVLLELDNTQAMNALRGAEASLQHAEDGYNRAVKVHDKGVIADQKMVEIESQRAQAQSLYESAKRQVEECSLVAPSEGIVTDLEVEQGQSVMPGTPVCSILDVSGFAVRFTVPEKEINGLGKKGMVECAAVDRVLPVEVTETGVAANPVTHTYEVVARVQGGKEVLKAGMVGVVKISNLQSPISNSDIIIPARCILLKPEGHTVWVVEQGTAVRRDIQIDGYMADGVRVLSGIQAGDTLIIDGYQKLYNGCKVNCEL